RNEPQRHRGHRGKTHREDRKSVKKGTHSHLHALMFSLCVPVSVPSVPLWFVFYRFIALIRSAAWALTSLYSELPWASMATISGPKSFTRNFHRHSGIRSSHHT